MGKPASPPPSFSSWADPRRVHAEYTQDFVFDGVCNLSVVLWSQAASQAEGLESDVIFVKHQ